MRVGREIERESGTREYEWDEIESEVGKRECESRTRQRERRVRVGRKRGLELGKTN